jgi:putative transposase
MNDRRSYVSERHDQEENPFQAQPREDRGTDSGSRAQGQQCRDLSARRHQSTAILSLEIESERGHDPGPQRDETRQKAQGKQCRARIADRRSRQAPCDALRSDNRIDLAQKKRELGLQGPLKGRHLSLELRRNLLAIIDEALSGGETLAAIAATLEVNPRAVYRWRRALAASPKPHGGAGGLNKLRPLEIKRVIDYAQKNPEHRCRRIAYALEKKGTWIGKTKVAEILKENGLNHAWDPSSRKPDIPPEDMLRHEPRTKNLLWGLDWTWVRVADKHMYLTVLLDWYSRKILSWTLSHQITSHQVVAVVIDAVAIERIDQLPETELKPLLVADHGSPNVSRWTRQNIEVQGLKLWLSGIGRPTGNARTERVIGTLKTEEIKLQDCYVDEAEAQRRIAAVIHDYNFSRPNMGVGGFAPNAVHHMGRKALMERRKSGRESTRSSRHVYWKSQDAMTTKGILT